jgi:hypothetical protein
MRYQAEETIHNFPFWSGAKDTIAELTYDEMNSLEQLIKEVLYDGVELPTDTEINDFVWFERDTIAEYLGYEDFEELMHRNDEPNLPAELFVDRNDIDEDWEELDEDEKLDAISDYLSDEYEFCHDGFDYEESDDSNIHISNIKWDTTE